MKSLRKVASMLLVVQVAVVGLVASPGTASAAVVVPPGGAGHVCSDYTYIGSWHYWQTCAWADHQYVWFTVNFGNTGDTWWYPEIVYVDYIKSGVNGTCSKGTWTAPAIGVAPHSVLGTPRLNCVLTRVRAAYASRARVWDAQGTRFDEVHSPTLQVQ